MQILPSGAMIFPSIGQALSFAGKDETIHHVFFAGGKECWEEGLRLSSRAIITTVHRPIENQHGLVRLEKPLGEMATDQGFVPIGHGSKIRNPKAWALEITITEYHKP